MQSIKYAITDISNLSVGSLINDPLQTLQIKLYDDILDTLYDKMSSSSARKYGIQDTINFIKKQNPKYGIVHLHVLEHTYISRIYDWSSIPLLVSGNVLSVIRLDDVKQFIPDGRHVLYDQVMTTLNGELHSYDDEPSMCSEYIKLWHLNDMIHRDGDKPAIIKNNGNNKYWFKKGKVHRDGDKPAVIKNMSKYWFKNDQQHRDGDKPASITVTDDDCEYIWYVYNLKFRENNKPEKITNDQLVWMHTIYEPLSLLNMSPTIENMKPNIITKSGKVSWRYELININNIEDVVVSSIDKNVVCFIMNKFIKDKPMMMKLFKDGSSIMMRNNIMYMVHGNEKDLFALYDNIRVSLVNEAAHYWDVVDVEGEVV